MTVFCNFTVLVCPVHYLLSALSFDLIYLTLHAYGTIIVGLCVGSQLVGVYTLSDDRLFVFLYMYVFDSINIVLYI